MSAMTLALLLAAASATAVGAAALRTARGLRRQMDALHTELARATAERRQVASVPTARSTPAAEIRTAVADALAEERERELAEARAFWAAQEARDMLGAGDVPPPYGGLGGLGDDVAAGPQPGLHPFIPRQADYAGLERLPDSDMSDVTPEPAWERFADPGEDPADEVELDVDVVESVERAAARRRHPSHPDFTPTPRITDQERTGHRLDELAEAGTPLTDVRPGPLGTLDVYVFADGSTVCLTPGHRETADRFAAALRDGVTPVLLGSSGVSGGAALTFDCDGEKVYVLADRVIASR